VKGVGSVIERVKHLVREQILRQPAENADNAKSKTSQEVVLDWLGS
jgi:hypothetical protein